MNQIPPFRRQRAYISQFTTTLLHLKNPWIVAFFSFSYPGFGHFLQHRYASAFILILWESFINAKAHLNLGIFYSLLGDFEKAKEVLNQQWLFLYVAIYMFGIWDGYRTTVDLNKQFLLAERENAPITNFKIGSWDMNYLDKRKPWVAIAWSALFPGLGQLYLHNVIAGFFMFIYTITICYFGNILGAMNLTMLGRFAEVKQSLNIQWLLYFPSIYFFIVYDAYVSSVENNKLFEIEMSKYLKQKYQDPDYEFPI
ncbi:hypothetical protein [Bacillus sp. USDA818B3_A]|uniref:hypothetical protein n=1 Tax=Bacillus sp. USDA818B3_A TaxID=2698834 RepID=UPI001368E74C|nr:hypothetical protein [Bacillus sp. USDA818B3_A]